MRDILAEVEAELADKIFAYLKRESVPEYANRAPVEGYAWLNPRSSKAYQVLRAALDGVDAT